MRVQTRCGCLSAGLAAVIAAGVLLLPDSGAADPIKDFYWRAARPGGGHVDNYPGHPYYPLGPMTDSGTVLHLWNTPGESVGIEFTGDYYVSKSGPGAEVSLVGVGEGIETGGVTVLSATESAYAQFEYEVRVVRRTNPPTAAVDCYVPLSLKAFGQASLVLTTPVNASASASLIVPEHYILDGSEYKYQEALTEASLAQYDIPYTGEQESVVQSADFLLDEKIYVHMTERSGLVVLPIWAQVQANGTVSAITGCQSCTIGSDPVGGFLVGQAFVDPVFEIDPAWELADSFSILVSPGVEQVFRTPEPSTGDFDGDGFLTVTDIDMLTGEVMAGTNSPEFDLNDDSLVNEQDHRMWVKDLTNTWIGDADLNGEFNSSDMIAVFQAGQYETGGDAGWSEGDWNGDGIFDSGDLILAFQDGGYEQGPREAVSAVPEPTSWVSLLAGLIGLATVSNSRRKSV